MCIVGDSIPYIGRLSARNAERINESNVCAFCSANCSRISGMLVLLINIIIIVYYYYYYYCYYYYYLSNVLKTHVYI